MSLVRAASLTYYSDVARAAGLDASRMLAEARLSPGVLQEPDLQIPVERVGHLLQASAAASGDDCFGLRMAESRRVSNLGAVGLLIRDQPNLRDSLAMLVRYHARFNDSPTLTIEESAGVVVIGVEVIAGHLHPVRQSVELALGVMVRLLRQFLGDGWHPRRVCLVHPPPRDTRTHRRVFGPSVTFDADFNGIVFARADLEASNPSADPLMARYAQKLLEASIPAPDATVLDDVRRTIVLLLPSGDCTIERVCDHLGLVCRTVQRRLADHGETFSSLLNGIRRQLARRRVSESDRPMAEVAASLGFAAPCGFSRWYRDQFGCSPRQARRGVQAGD